MPSTKSAPTFFETVNLHFEKAAALTDVLSGGRVRDYRPGRA